MTIRSAIRGAVRSPLRGALESKWGGGAQTLTQQVLALSPTAMFDMSNLSTLFQDSGASTAVTADSDPVGYIADLSGNGNHLTQSTAGARPTYKTSGGLHWVEGDGSADWINNTTVEFGTAFGAGVATRCIAETGGRCFSVSAAAGSNFRNSLQAIFGFWAWYDQTDNTGNLGGSTSAGTDLYFTIDYSTSTISARRNGSAANSFDPYDMVAGDQGLAFFSQTTDSGVGFGNFRIYRFVIRDSAFSTDEKAIVEAWLAEGLGL